MYVYDGIKVNTSQRKKYFKKIFENVNITHFVFNNFFSKIVFVCDIVEKHGTTRAATDDNTIRRKRFACRITKATDTHSEYLTLIDF